MKDHTYYEQIAHDIEGGWTRGAWENGRGESYSKCLVQSIRNHSGGIAPPEVLTEVHEQLKQEHWDYRILVRLMPPGDTRRIVWWNDLPWRKKEQVVRAMQRIAAEKEFAWLREERMRLSIEISALRDEIADLRERLVCMSAEHYALLKENASLRARVTKAFDAGYRAWRVDQQTLVELDAELGEKLDRYEGLSRV